MMNQDIRAEVKKAGVKLWQIADEMGVSDMTLSRKLRYELSDKQKSEIRNIIFDLSKENLLREEGA